MQPREAQAQDAHGDQQFYLGLGPLVAIGLGLALVPLRTVTHASNFTFAFLALTILVAEYGGRAPAVFTAVASALSLDFFLTEPYMQLTIADKHDVIAFVGLAGCGLLAAALASERHERKPAPEDLELLRAALRSLTEGGPDECRLEGLLQRTGQALPVAALVLRDEHDRVLALSERAAGLRPLPERLLQPETLLGSAGPGSPPPERPLPEAGGRLALDCAGHRYGWLDVWGNGVAADAASRRTLSDLARLLAVSLAASVPR